MLVVLDASAAVDLLLSTQRGSKVAQVLRSVTVVHATELIDPEVIAVVRRWTLRGWLAVETGGRAIDELGELASSVTGTSRYVAERGSCGIAAPPTTPATWHLPRQ